VRQYTDGRGRQRYAVEFQQGGSRVLRRAPPGITLAQAKELETTLRRDLFSQDALGHRPDVLLKDVVQSWLDTKPQQHHRDLVNKANQWAPYLKTSPQPKDVLSVASAALKDWDGLSVATKNRRLAVLKGALKWAYVSGILAENYSPRLKLRREQNTREIYLTKAQVKRLATLAPTKEIGDAITLSAYTGLRAAELLALTVGTTTRSGTLMVARSKGGRPRQIPVSKSALPCLRHLPFALSYWQLRKGFITARTQAGLGPEVTFHCLRHTFASWMINKGVDLLTLSKLMGHANVSVTQRYAHLYDSSLRKAVAKL